MTTEKERRTTAMAVVCSLLGGAILLILALVQGPEKWFLLAAAGIALLAFLVPVLRGIRAGRGR